MNSFKEELVQNVLDKGMEKHCMMCSFQGKFLSL